MQILVKNPKARQSYTVEAEPGDSIKDLKAKLHEQGADVRLFQLAFKGKKLTSDDATLESVAVKNKSTMVLIPLPKHLQPPPEEKAEPEPTAEPMEEDKPAEPEEPVEPPALCLANCGFYGTAKQKGYCSKCYSDLGMAEEETAEEKAEAEKEKQAEEKAEADEPKILQEDVTRCWKCRRDVGLLGFKCQCKYVFCAKHRYGDKHDCPVDYRAREQKKLNKNLEKVVGGKVMRIG
mmetsp:Transcript_1226/g.4408  ORF Transcript_1226/g.4408 Transcript_1226/m.4408 type:complete len:235 (-) Transcript_1226:90-794(-)